jgi:tRNA(adenine34) deaminase
MGKIIYGAKDAKRGALGGTINLAKHKSAHHNMLIEGGIMEEESRRIIVDWFKDKRVLPRESLLSKLR